MTRTVEGKIQSLREQALEDIGLMRRVKGLEETTVRLLGGEERMVVELEDSDPGLLVELTRTVRQAGFERLTGIPRMRERIGVRVKEDGHGDSFRFTRGGVHVHLKGEPTVMLDLDLETVSLFEEVLGRVSEKID